ncbi:restriction endonuclease subunit S [Corynebacterium casei]|uniref:restriction endonuclease subunit S n=1 Tax=Corynebacterium casei TaxID=160386 RepID=UPI003FD00195
MSHIDNLIEKLCPSGVEHRELQEVAAYSRTRVESSLLDKSNFVGVDNLLPNKGGKTDAQYPPNTVRLTAFKVGDILLGNIRPYLKKIWLASLSGGCSGDVLAIRISEDFQATLSPEFLYYILSSDNFFSYNMKHAKGAKMPRGSKESILKYRVPIPPIEIQNAIVNILDKFVKLEAELEAELEARRRQYYFYRLVLLKSSDEPGFRDFSLGDIIQLNFGERITKKNNMGTVYPVYGGGGESFRTDSFNRENEWVISRFAMSANCVRKVEGKFWMLDSGFTFDVIDESVDKDFVGQTLLSMQPIIFATSTQSAQKNIDVDGFRRLRVQVPSLETQRRVASELAVFDELVNDLSSGLPAEIAARRKQYEYYRDRLLTFKEVVTRT